MYLNGRSNLHYRKRGRRTHWGRAAVLAAAIGGLLYFNQYVVPTIPPPFLPTPTATRSPISYAEEAEAQFAAGRLPDAIAAYQEAIRADPRNVDYHVALARLQVYNREPEAALETANTAILINPDSSSAHAVRALALDWTGDYEEAANAAVNALRLDPNNGLAHAYYAEVLTDQQKWAQAADEARLALALMPGSLDAHRAYGYVLESTGDYRGAVQQYEAALAVNPNLIFLYMAIGRMYGFGLGDPNRAIEAFQKAAAVDPENPAPYSQIARMYAGLGEYGKASQYAAQALEFDPANPALHGLLGIMYYHNRNYEGAHPELELAVEGGVTEEGDVPGGIIVEPLVKDSGDAVEIYYTYGLNLFYGAHCDRAVPIFQDVLRTWPEHPIAVANANEGIRLCQEASAAAQATALGTPSATDLAVLGTVMPTETEEPEPSETPAP
jgi:tetratricopeptide (TPR) repeat protein